MKVSLLQIEVAAGSPDENFRRVADGLEQAVSVEQADKPDVILLPELWNTGYALAQIDRLADVEGERTKTFISAFCRRRQVVVIAGSVAVKSGDSVKNVAYTFDRNGHLTAEYAKLHLFRLMDEHRFLQNGDAIGKLHIDGVPSGLMICYDLRFPELARKLALDGAKVLFVPAQWPEPRLHHWRSLLIARAIENQMFVVACNRVGTSGNSRFFGHSLVIDPWGEIISEGGETEQMITASLQIARVDEVRSTIPVFEDRRPALY